MNIDQNIKSHLDISSNQLFVLSTPISVPLSFACHLWIVVNKKGELYRYEVISSKNYTSNIVGFNKDGHIYKNV